MVYRIFVERKRNFSNEAVVLLNQIRETCGINSLRDIRVLERYDLEHISKELFEACRYTVFAEAQLDMVYQHLSEADQTLAFAVETSGAKTDQKAETAARCIRIISPGERPIVRTARVYLLFGHLSAVELQKIKDMIIDSKTEQEAQMEEYETLKGMGFGTLLKGDAEEGTDGGRKERMAVFLEAMVNGSSLRDALEVKLEGTVHFCAPWSKDNTEDMIRKFLEQSDVRNLIGSRPKTFTPLEKPAKKYFSDAYFEMARDRDTSSPNDFRDGFDSVISVGAVLMPFGGKYQMTSAQPIVGRIPEAEDGKSCFLIAWGGNPDLLKNNTYYGSYLAAVDALSKLIASGANCQEGLLCLQMSEQVAGAATGDLSGLVALAITTEKSEYIIAPEFKAGDHRVLVLKPEYDEEGLPVWSSLERNFRLVNELCRNGDACSVYTMGSGGAAEAVVKMALGNGIGFVYEDDLTTEEIFRQYYGSFLLEMQTGKKVEGTQLLGTTVTDESIYYRENRITLAALQTLYENSAEQEAAEKLRSRYQDIPAFSYTCHTKMKSNRPMTQPHVLIPIFPGTNCEYAASREFRAAGADPEYLIIQDLSPAGVYDAVQRAVKAIEHSQIIYIPGGFSGFGQLGGFGKYVNAFFRNEAVKEAINNLLQKRDGLMGGVDNGFQALIKLGLLPYGEIVDMSEKSPILTFNTVSLSYPKMVRIRVASNKSPWFSETKPGEVYTVPISRGEGRFLASDDVVFGLAKNGQIATQYVNFEDEPTMDVKFNPSGSSFAVEGILSPDGRVFGKMGHSEQAGGGLYKNMQADYDMGLFRSAVEYFK